MSEKLKIILGYILICLLWGSTWLAIRIGLESLTPFLAAGARFIVASLFVYVFMKIRGIKLQTDALSIRLYFILSIFSFVIPFGMVYWAEQYIQSGLSSIIFASMPFFVILFTYFAIKNELILASQIVGVIFGFIGIVIIFSENLQMNLSKDMLGMLVLLGSAIIQSGIAIIIKKWGNHLNPLSMNFLPLLSAGIIMVLFALKIENFSKVRLDNKAVLTVVYLGFFGTVLSFTTYYWLMKRINIVLLSLSSFITPIIAVILGWVVLNEKLSYRTIIGSALVLVGILFANFSGLKKYLFKSRFRNA